MNAVSNRTRQPGGIDQLAVSFMPMAKYHLAREITDMSVHSNRSREVFQLQEGGKPVYLMRVQSDLFRQPVLVSDGKRMELLFASDKGSFQFRQTDRGVLPVKETPDATFNYSVSFDAPGGISPAFFTPCYMVFGEPKAFAYSEQAPVFMDLP
jgi:hypothetical protein